VYSEQLNVATTWARQVFVEEAESARCAISVRIANRFRPPRISARPHPREPLQLFAAANDNLSAPSAFRAAIPRDHPFDLAFECAEAGPKTAKIPHGKAPEMPGSR
jgi:hypothetical protein